MNVWQVSLALGLALAGCRGHSSSEGARPAGSGGPAGAAAVSSTATGPTLGGVSAGWVRVIGGGSYDGAYGVALTEDGATIVGYFYDALTVPGAVRAVGDSDVFVARLDRSGAVRWLRTFGSPRPDFAWGVATLGELSVIAAESDATMDIDGVPSRTPAHESVAETPAVAIALDGSGHRAWVRTLGAESGELRVVVRAGDGVVAGGQALTRTGTLDLGTGSMKCDIMAGVVVRLGGDGVPAWARCGWTKFGVASQLVQHLAATADGASAACGGATGVPSRSAT